MRKTLNRSLVLAFGALALLGAGAAARRSAPTSMRAEAPAALPEVQVAASSSPAPVLTRPEADRALKIARLLTEAARPGGSDEISASKVRQARFEGEQLVQFLHADQEAWSDILDLLSCLESPDIAVDVARLLQEAVDPAFERRYLDRLRAGTSQTRRVMLALLGRRDSGEALSAVLAGLEDPDPRLRQEVLQVLAERRAHRDSTTADATIEAELRRHAESDPGLQAMCRAILGEAPGSSAPAPRRTAFSGSSIGSRPRPTRSP